ncbi:PD40 domain-containing protein [Nocardia vaccinii]|uniref:PD40 domain-containing protein n=1 Tax=Nocardia vaccinii TaxID=1822 RepID=UPI001472015C|nr:PD40 domain-containing protein [Nocardia vaccinii]
MLRAVVVAVAVSGLVAGCGVDLGQSPRPAKIVFEGEERHSNVEYTIFGMNPDGTGITPIGEGACPSFARDGSKIAVGGFWITVMDRDGGHVRKLIHGGYGCPVFSPDGSKIAFTRGGAVYLMNADGGAVQQLHVDSLELDPSGHFPHGQDQDGPSTDRPAFSPDGSKIVISDSGVMWVMASDGTGARQLLPGEVYADFDPVFTPDGAGIVFSSSRPPNGGIYRMDVDGRNIRLLRADGYCPSFSPDGTKILYSRMTRDPASTQGATFTELWVMNSDGSNPHRLTDPKVSVRSAVYGSWGREANT